MFVDSDDFIEDGLLKSAIAEIENHDADEYICGLVMEQYINGKITNTEKHSIKKTKLYYLKNLLEDFLQEYPLMCLCGPWCKLYKSEIIKKIT